MVGATEAVEPMKMIWNWKMKKKMLKKGKFVDFVVNTIKIWYKIGFKVEDRDPKTLDQLIIAITNLNESIADTSEPVFLIVAQG